MLVSREIGTCPSRKAKGKMDGYLLPTRKSARYASASAARRCRGVKLDDDDVSGVDWKRRRRGVEGGLERSRFVRAEAGDWYG